MAKRKNLFHDDETRRKIQTSQLVNRLTDHANGKIEMSPTQVKAAEVLLKKSLPDLAAIQLGGDEENPLQFALAGMKEILASRIARRSAGG